MEIEMSKWLKLGWMGGALVLAAGALQADGVWSNDFSEASLNANYTVFKAGAGAAVTQTGGQLVMNTAVVNGSAQAAVNTTTDQTGTVTIFNGANLYNFYNHQVKVRFDIASITGTSGTGRNVFYLSIGDDTAGNYAPQGNVLDNGIGFRIEQISTGWRIMYTGLVNGIESGGTVALIGGVPTAITYTLEGTSATIQMEGATITAVGSLGSGTTGGTDLTVALADLSTNISGYTMAFGAYNWGNISEKTVVTLDSITVEVIPEPATLGLFNIPPVRPFVFARR